MAFVSSSMGLTLRLREDSNEYIRIQAEISAIDTELPLEPQLEAAKKTMNKTISTIERLLDDKLEALIKREVLKVGPEPPDPED